MMAEVFLDAIVVEESQGYGCFADTSCTNEGNGGEVLSKVDNSLNQVVASEE